MPSRGAVDFAHGVSDVSGIGIGRRLLFAWLRGVRGGAEQNIHGILTAKETVNKLLLDTTSVRVFLVPDLHAKGVVTPLGIITGSTNITHSGLYAQSQSANYFAYDSADYAGNRTQLLGRYEGLTAVAEIP